MIAALIILRSLAYRGGVLSAFDNLGGKDFQRNGKSIDEPGYETYLLADEAPHYIKTRDKIDPFFFYIPFLALMSRSPRRRI